MQLLEVAWEQVEAGRRQIVFVGGEPGAGKTRLAAEVAAVLVEQDVAVLVGTARAEGGIPYQPFTEMLDDLLGGAPTGSLSAMLDGIAPEIARLSARAGDHVVVEHSLDETTRKLRWDLFEAVSQLFRRLSADQPLVLIFDDLHWAQAPTLAMLEHVVLQCADRPMLVVGTFRTTAPDRSDVLATWMANLHRYDGVRRLDLNGLDTDAIADYVRLRGVPAGGSLREVAAILRDRTDGNAFFLRELMADIERTGDVSSITASRSVPTTVGDALGARLDGLSCETREVLDVAAVLGDVFDLGALMAVSDLDRSATFDAVDGAESVGLVRRVPDRDDVYCFVHSLARQTVLDRMAPHNRAVAHARVADWLARRDDPTVIPSLANHYLAARILGYSEQAIEYSELAGRRAEGILAYEDAARWFERAASLPECDAERRGRLFFAAARNHLRAGDFAKARGVYEHLVTLPDPLVRLEAAIGFEDANWRPGLADPRPADLLATAIEQSALDPADPRCVRALASLGRGLVFAGDGTRAREVGERAIELARTTADPDTIDHALKTSLWHGLAPEHSAVQLSRATELSVSSRRRRDYETLGAASHFRCVAAYLGGLPDDLAEATDDLRRAAELGGQLFFAYVAACVEHGQALLRGDFDAATQWAQSALRNGDRLGLDHTEGSHGVQMFMIHRMRGDLGRYAAWIDGSESFDGRWVAGLLALYTELGLQDGMRRTLSPLVRRDLVRRTADAQWPMELAFMTEAALALGDSEALDVLRPFVASFEHKNIVAGQFVAAFGSGDRYLAQMAAADGDLATAETYFRSALEMDRRMGSLVHQAETLAHWALAVDGSDRPARAEEVKGLAEQARRLAEPFGHARIERLLDRLDRGQAPDNLTDREVDVLRLLAGGLSNREIGRQLFISSHTAANHVRNILIKTQAANRTQAAMYAADHQLL